MVAMSGYDGNSLSYSFVGISANQNQCNLNTLLI